MTSRTPGCHCPTHTLRVVTAHPHAQGCHRPPTRSGVSPPTHTLRVITAHPHAQGCHRPPTARPVATAPAAKYILPMQLPYPSAHAFPLILAPMAGVSEAPFRQIC